MLFRSLKNRKINYFDFLCGGEYQEANAALKRIVPRIDMDQIERFIDDVPGITELQKEFYKTYIKARYVLIVLTALKKIETL